jgi:hypothetical protein
MTEYTTERGITIEIVPIPLLLDKVRSAHPDVPPPTYTEKLAGGARQEVVITEEMAATWQATDPQSWAEHAEKWAAYEAEQNARTEKLNDVLWRAVMRKAIIVQVPTDDSWIKEQRELGIEVPEDATARREHYIWTECIGGARDILRIMGLASGADLTEEQISAAEASFRDTIQRPAA